MNIKKLYHSQNCVSERLDDELIILNLETGKYHQLNDTGSFIWDLLGKRELSIEQIINEVQVHYKGCSIRDDVEHFINSLLDKGVFVEL